MSSVDVESTCDRNHEVEYERKSDEEYKAAGHVEVDLRRILVAGLERVAHQLVYGKQELGEHVQEEHHGINL